MVKCFPMQVVSQNLPKNTVKLTITLSAEEVKKAQEKVWTKIIESAEVDGFRKGKAPAELVKNKVDPKKAQGEIVVDLVSTYYPQALENQKLMPVIDPKIEATELEPEKDYIFSVTLATRPQVTVGDYKKAIKDVYNKKTAEHGGRGKQVLQRLEEVARAKAGTRDESVAKPANLSPNEVIDAITSVTTAEISDLLIEEEVNKMLSRLVNQVQAIKLDMDAYLKSQNKTAETLRTEYAAVAERQILSELALIEVAKNEGVEATDAEVEQTLNAMGDAKLKEQYSKDEYQKAYIKAIIAKNKVIWKLSSPEGDHEIKADDDKKEESDVKK